MSTGSLPPALLERARALRRDATDAERLLWSLLRNRRFLGLKFRRQHPLGGYILDFYCHEAGLGIELDGGQHAEPEQAARDAQRTRDLEELGVRVVRFWNHEVLKETEAVLEAILDAVENDPHPKTLSEGEDSPHPKPLSQRERGLKTGLPSPGGEGPGVRADRLQPLPTSGPADRRFPPPAPPKPARRRSESRGTKASIP